MSAHKIIAQRGTNQSLRMALTILGAIAACQLLTVGWALASRESPQVERDAPAQAQAENLGSDKALSPAMGGSGSIASTNPISTAPSPPVSQPIPAPLAQPTAPPSPLASPAQPVSDVPLLLLPPDKRISDPSILEAIADGVTLRNEGDTQGALARLRVADTARPDHPAILYELGETYELIGLTEKANAIWERIHSQGEGGAGDYFALADVRLRGGALDKNDPNASKAIQLGNISVSRDAAAASGERVILRLPMRKMGVEDIHNPSLIVYVFFYDLVDGERVERSTADAPTFNWRSMPVDWTGTGEEILEVVYYHPELSAEQERELGKREFHGYLIKVYYRDVLQDVIANPRTLVDHLDENTLDRPEGNGTLFDFEE